MKVPMIASLMAVSLCGFSQPAQQFKETLAAGVFPSENSEVRQSSNTKEVLANKTMLTRTQGYPTQVVRIEGELKDSQYDCEYVFAEIDEFFSDHITANQFYYNTITFCGYVPETGYAHKFSIYSYFDPMTDKAIDYLNTYLAEHNGHDLLGTTFEVENANGLAVSLNIDAGLITGRDKDVLTRIRHDNQSLYFPSNYDMIKELSADIYARFYSNDPDVVLPFMARWIFSFADQVYYYVLQKSDYVELMPERIFLMNKEPKVFTSPLRMYFAHNCAKYENKRCL